MAAGSRIFRFNLYRMGVILKWLTDLAADALLAAVRRIVPPLIAAAIALMVDAGLLDGAVGHQLVDALRVW